MIRSNIKYVTFKPLILLTSATIQFLDSGQCYIKTLRKGDCQMDIRCACCHKALEEDDVVILDFMNGLSHFRCFKLTAADAIKTIGFLATLREHYSFLEE